MEWVDARLPVSDMIKSQATEYPTPKNLNYWWNFGSLALFILIVMIATGLFLAMHYKPDAAIAFDVVEHIMRDVNYGWLLRYLHANGATFFFIVIYVHILRGMYYGSYRAPREILWWIGIIIFLMMMGTGFLGYVLPWGQMSYWGAAVITNLITAIPVVGEDLVIWVWGGFSVGDATINRFFVLHFLLPFVIFGLVILHMWALHAVHSNNPDGIDIVDEKKDTLPFHPYFTIKDLYGIGVLLIIYCWFVFFAPNAFLEPDNYIPANPMQTPAHIVPEWYFLPFYAILRSIDFLGSMSKLAGVIAMIGAICILFILPFLDRSPVRSFRYRPLSKSLFWIFVADCIMLGWVGYNPADATVFGGLPLIILGRTGTAIYFGYFVVLWFITALKIEKPLPLPKSL
ncbi:MAG: cytochrome b N-terminal domain-containing protein [Magnetococcales bacterium]|nr:cytochrome b N-terminal domain-containing protein [Magnetococcales bacterium]